MPCITALSLTGASLSQDPVVRFCGTPCAHVVNNYKLRGVTCIRREIKLSVKAASAASEQVLIVGGGIAGLSCAVQLAKSRVPFQVLEASDAVGGRVRTDKVEGFLLDRGFQIFLTGYPEAQAVLDYDALALQNFYAGADVWYDGSFHRVADPARHLFDGLQSLPNPIGTPLDKINVGLYRLKCLLGTWDELLTKPETTTMQALREEGFSDAIIDRFFRPFLGGIFFNNDLTMTSRLFSFVMRTLASGSNCLPYEGLGAVPEQLAARLPVGSIKVESRVTQVVPGSGQAAPVVRLANGQEVSGKLGVVVAVDEPAAAEILPGEVLGSSPSKPLPGVGTCCLYFRARRAPRPEPMLYLNGSGVGIVNNMCFPSTVAASYAPPGQALVSVSTVGTHPHLSDSQLVAAVVQEMAEWWGADTVADWTHLATYRIPFAQPNQEPPTDLRRLVRLGKRLYVCGDHRDSATLDGALKSGRRAAEAVLADIAVAIPEPVSVVN